MVVAELPVEYTASDTPYCGSQYHGQEKQKAMSRGAEKGVPGAGSLVDRLVDGIDRVAEFIDLKVCGERRESVGPGFYIRRGGCPDTLRAHGAAGFMHCHTIYSSDGRLQPEDLVRLAYEKGAKVLAITDHVARPKDKDEAASLYKGLKDCFSRARKAAKAYGIILIPGVEYNIEPCRYVKIDSEDVDVSAGHVGIHLPYDIDLKWFVKLMLGQKGETLNDFVEFAGKVRNAGGVIVANHVTQQDGIGERCLEHLVEEGVVDGVEDVNLSAGIIMPYHRDASGRIVPYSSGLGIASIAAQDSHGIPQASVATIFMREKLMRSVEGLELNSDRYFAAASREILRQIRDAETASYFEMRDFKFMASAALEKFRLLHPLMMAKLVTIGLTSPDLFSTFFGRTFTRGKPTLGRKGGTDRSFAGPVTTFEDTFEELKDHLSDDDRRKLEEYYSRSRDSAAGDVAKT